MSAFGQAKLPIDDHPLAGREALGDNGNPVLDRGHLDSPPLDRVVGFYDVGIGTVGPGLDGLRRHRRHIGAHPQDQPKADEFAGP